MTNIGCQVVLTNTAIDITLNDQLVYHGCKRPMDTLWLIDIDKLQLGFEPVSHTASLTIKYDTDAELVAFIHATFGSPPLSTFLHAARQGWLDQIPRITASMIAANAPNTLATAMSYLDQTRQVKKSRRPQSLSQRTSVPLSDIDDLIGDMSEAIADVYVKLVPTSDIAHVDLTGRFPIKSRKGHEYILVAVWDGYVHYEPMSSHASASYILAYKRLIAFYKSLGRAPLF